MPASQVITLSSNDWVDVTGGYRFGYFTNHTDRYIMYWQSPTKPAASFNKGHRLNPGADKQFVLNNSDKIWARSISTLDGRIEVILTPGYNSLTSGGPQNRDFLATVNQGLVEGHSLVYVFGRKPDVSTSHNPIWEVGGPIPWIQTAETMDVVSSDTVNDIATGTGARSIKIYGLDSDFNEIEEVIALAATPVTTTNAFQRINLIEVETVGAYTGTNQGDITLTGSVSTNIHGQISALAGRSAQSQYTVPAGKTAYLLKVSISIETGKTVTLHLHHREGADIVAAPFTPNRHLHEWDGLDTALEEHFNANHVFPEKTDIWFAGYVSATDASVQLDYDLLLVDN